MPTIAAAALVAIVGVALIRMLRSDPDVLRRPRVASAGAESLDQPLEPRAPSELDDPGEVAHPAGSAATGTERVITALRTKPWVRRGLSFVSVALLVGAVAMLGYPLYTNFYADRRQAQLDRQLASPELEEAYRQGRVEEGDSLTRIRIPAIDVDVVVVEGVGGSALRAGAGHYPRSTLPCESGNVGIAGHRTTYGRPFHNLDRLEPGDTIILETPIGSCTYEVATDPFIVSPHNVEVVDDTPGEANLTLTTCHPKGSASQRLIVRAALVDGAIGAT